MTGLASSMLAAEHSREFADLYRRLGLSLVCYLGRNLGGLVLGCLPLIALTVALSGAVFGPRDLKAGKPRVYPHGAATLRQQELGSPLLLDMHDAREPIIIESTDPIRAAVCWRVLPCLVLRSLDFSVAVLHAPSRSDYGAVIVRPDQASWNPFFPYLNDLEFMFFGMTAVGAAAAMFIRQKRT